MIHHRDSPGVLRPISRARVLARMRSTRLCLDPNPVKCYREVIRIVRTRIVCELIINKGHPGRPLVPSVITALGEAERPPVVVDFMLLYP